MVDSIINRLNFPMNLKELSLDECRMLAADIRAEIIAATSVNGGHTAPSLGAVDIIMACHRAMDLPYDKLVFDVGHQAYAHKILSGRRDEFVGLRKTDGLSGFPKREESEYDVHDSGHASDSLATALGLVIARDLDGQKRKIVSIIGDASLPGGLSMEALNLIGTLQKSIVIILNDNEMSISPSVGAFNNYLGTIRTSLKYNNLRNHVEDTLISSGQVGNALMRVGDAAKWATKQVLVESGMFFEDLGIKYLGPVDGHDMYAVQDSLERAFKVGGPVIIHAVTKKGKGYGPAERNPSVFHGVGPFDIETGRVAKKPGNPKFTNIFSDCLIEEAKKDENLVAITAGMTGGTGLLDFKKQFSKRFFDVGIAEECAVTMASGMALAGKKPVVAIYSTFLQRAFDEIVINVCMQKQPVILAIDRGGIVGADGPTHHGAFDMAYLRMIPNISIAAPSDEATMHQVMSLACEGKGPFALRYPRGEAPLDFNVTEEYESEIGKSRVIFDTSEDEAPFATVLAIGITCKYAVEAAKRLAEQGISCRVIDMLWVKPIDESAVIRANESSLVVTIEDGCISGGFGGAVAEYMAQNDLTSDLEIMGIPDSFVEQGDTKVLHERLGLSASGIVEKVMVKHTALGEGIE